MAAVLALATIGSFVLDSAAPEAAYAARFAQGVVPAPAAAPLPPGFQETTPIAGLTYPTALRFAADGRVFVALKNGRILVYSDLADTSPTQFNDLLTNVHDYWDRGLLGLALDPSLTGGSGNGSYVYVMYAYNHILGDPAAAPKWPDSCPGAPAGPGGNTDGCVISNRVSRFPVSGTTISGPEDVLIEDWCQQFPSHSAGSLVFGPDGSLYVSGGEGANFNLVDYGQRGGTLPTSGPPYVTPKNPCGDPPGGVGGSMTIPTAQGGALRSQDIRTSGDPTGLGGTILRVNPNTGLGASGNPFAGSSDANERRIIAYGLRNPFRITPRPGTNELWFGDVGWETWEEINRIPNMTDGVAENFGWPCYEGTATQAGYAPLDMCDDLYDEGAGAVANPIFKYHHDAEVTAGESCPEGIGSSTTGVAFYPESGGPFPAAYRGGLFFADQSRDCIWFIPKGSNGQPDPSAVQIFRDGAEDPVDLAIGPGGDLFYVDFGNVTNCTTCGSIKRISPPSPNQPPTAVIEAVPTSGAAPLQVDFDASGSSDPEGGALTYAWDLDGDGAYDDSTAVSPQWTYTAVASVTVRLRVTDPGLATGTDTQLITPGNTAPVPVISTPSGSFTWHVGESISFSGSATDAQDGNVPASGLSWTLVMKHGACPNCHSHNIETLSGVASGSFTAPPHEYPSSLELTLTATDSFGTPASTTRVLQPETVNLTFATITTGLALTLNGASATAPFTRTVIVGSDNSVSAPSPQIKSGTSYTFKSWSDGGLQSHDITAPGSNATYTATYQATAPGFLPFTPTADSQVRPKKPSKNYGHASTLRVRLEKARTFVKFVVTGLTGPPSDAKLRLWVTNPSSRGGQVFKVGNSWTETGVTWNNKPALTGSWLSRVMSAPSGTWVEFDLGSAITGNGTYSFAIKAGSDDYVEYSSREGSMDPILVLTP